MELESFLASGKLDDGEKALKEHLTRMPGDGTARFGLGTVQFLQAVEHLAQSLYRYGALSGTWTRNIPLLRVATPAGINPDPRPVSYADVRKVLQDWVNDLGEAEATLAAMQPVDVKLPLRIGMARLDLNGDGQASEEETLWRLYVQLNAQARGMKAEDAQRFVIMLDAGDVHWLRGYCHLLMAFGEMALAHDGQELFNTAGHVLFARAQTPHGWIGESIALADLGQGIDIADAIAFIHMIRLPVSEPQRMQTALKHLQAMLAESRLSWRLIQAETDNDHEWIPRPGQNSVIPNAAVSAEMVHAWQEFLAEGEAVLAGKKLIPFWRSKELGVNLNKVFMEPRAFDLVLWVQGTAATPYLEKGEMSRPETWQRLMRVFQGEFIGYAIWFN